MKVFDTVSDCFLQANHLLDGLPIVLLSRHRFREADCPGSCGMLHRKAYLWGQILKLKKPPCGVVVYHSKLTVWPGLNIGTCWFLTWWDEPQGSDTI